MTMEGLDIGFTTVMGEARGGPGRVSEPPGSCRTALPVYMQSMHTGARESFPRFSSEAEEADGPSFLFLGRNLA